MEIVIHQVTQCQTHPFCHCVLECSVWVPVHSRVAALWLNVTMVLYWTYQWEVKVWALSTQLEEKKTQKVIVFFTFVCKNFSFLNRATKTPKEITKILNWTLNIFTSLICLLKSNYSTVASHQVIHHYTQDSPTSLTLQMLLIFSFLSLFMLSKL